MTIRNLFLTIFLVFCLFSVNEAKKRSDKSSIITSTDVPAFVVTSTAAVEIDTGTYELEIDTRTNIDKLTDTDSIVRRNAVIFLGTEKKVKNIKYLVKMLNDETPAVRRVTVRSLVESCITTNAKKSVVQSILDHFDSEKDTGVQIDCIEAFGQLKSKKAVPKLKLLLKHRYPLIRTYTTKSLGEIADVTVYPLFVKMLINETGSVRIQSAKIVAKLKIKSAVPNLLTNLKHPINKVRRAAVDALGELGDAKVLPQLEEMLNDKDKRVVQKAKFAIKKIKKRFKKQLGIITE